MKIIDPHLHLFDLSQGEYSWLKPECPPFWPDKSLVAKNFSEHDLRLNESLKLTGFVHIEAGFNNQQPWREIAWLENTCKLPFRSVAMLDITLPNVEFLSQLNKLSSYKSVVGIRYILDENALAILSHKNCATNLVTLASYKLSFDLQMPLSNNAAVDKLLAVLTLASELKVCINHAGWPPLYSLKDNEKSNEKSNEKDNIQTQQWLQNLKRLASLDNIYIKCSGFEMIEKNYSISWAHNIIHQCINTFGISRVMLASNFPLNLFQTSYQNTWLSYLSLTKNSLSNITNISNTESADTSFLYNNEQFTQLCFSNAQRFYQF